MTRMDTIDHRSDLFNEIANKSLHLKFNAVY